MEKGKWGRSLDKAKLDQEESRPDQEETMSDQSMPVTRQNQLQNKYKNPNYNIQYSQNSFLKLQKNG